MDFRLNQINISKNYFKQLNCMKKFLLALVFIFCAMAGRSQGLERIVVEKYYVSDANDATGSSGVLPVGSVTWRIYVDMAPGWYLLQVFGNQNLNHPLLMTTTTSFFNDPDYGTYTPSNSANNTKKSTMMLDSWISTGSACTGYLGILKSEDNSIGTFINKNGLLQNNDPAAGIPLTVQDGMVAGTNPNFSTAGIPDSLLNVFGDGSVTGNTFKLTNGSWYSLTHPQGTTSSNRVLIAQITTDGTFHYELNVLIGKDLGNDLSASETYVASNPSGDEISSTKYNLSGTLSPSSTISDFKIVSPVDGSSFNEGNIVSITANTNGADGTIAKVEFKVNGSKIGESSTIPGKIDWTAIAPSAILTAIGTDFEGNTITSTPVNISILGNKAPLVVITAPVDSSTVITGDTILFSADASDSDGTIANVEFFVDSVSKGIVTNVPYKISWNAVAAGKYSFKAVATDNKSTKTSAKILVFVKDNQAPQVSFMAPINNSELSKDSSYLIQITAVDVDGKISKVELFVDGTKLDEKSSVRYEFKWSSSILGIHTFTAKATDERGAASTSTISIKIVTGNLAPTVIISAPVTGYASLVGDSIVILADANDVDGTVASVEFYIDDSSMGIINAAPYQIKYRAILGNHIISAKATDNIGATGTSEPVSIIVNNNLPVISITAPVDGSSVSTGDSVSIFTDASDVDGTIASVEFFVDNVSIGLVNKLPYQLKFLAVAGTHSISATATDNNGGHTTSSSISLDVITGVSVVFISSSSFKVYPNPGVNDITLDMSGLGKQQKVSFKIINSEGKLIEIRIIGTISENHKENFKISNLEKGLYTIILTIDGEEIIQRFIKL